MAVAEPCKTSMVPPVNWNWPDSAASMKVEVNVCAHLARHERGNNLQKRRRTAVRLVGMAQNARHPESMLRGRRESGDNALHDHMAD